MLGSVCVSFVKCVYDASNTVDIRRYSHWISLNVNYHANAIFSFWLSCREWFSTSSRQLPHILEANTLEHCVNLNICGLRLCVCTWIVDLAHTYLWNTSQWPFDVYSFTFSPQHPLSECPVSNLTVDFVLALLIYEQNGSSFYSNFYEFVQTDKSF